MKKLVLALLAASCAIPAFAGNIYAGGSIGFAQQEVTPFGYDSVTKNTTGINVFGGYQFTPMFGAEVGYAQFGNAKNSNGTASSSLKPSALYVAATGTWPLTDKLAGFAKVGVARDHIELSANDGFGSYFSGSENTTSALIGVGASYAVSAKVSIIAEYEYFGKVAKDDTGTVKVGQVSIGARYKF